MSRFIYSVLFLLLLPLVFFNLYRRGSKAPAYRRRWLERLGIKRLPKMERSLWLHAVSVGEVLAAEPIVRSLMRRYPNYPVVVTTMTPTGSERVRAIFGDQVCHQYLPYDIPWALRAFIRTLAPQICIIMETELWPNLIHQCRIHGVPVVVSNARLSQQSAAGYARARGLSQKMMQEIDQVMVQSEDERQRFISLGLDGEKITVTGSLKFSITVEDNLKLESTKLRQQWAGRRCLIAASTHKGEDELILDAYEEIKQTHGDALLIIVPRHPERFQQVATLIEQRSFRFVRRSEAEPVVASTEVLLVDTMGEMSIMLGAADVAFVGGSLLPVGGHNVLEPVALGLPVITGPHIFNFQSIVNMLLERKGITVVQNEVHLAQACLTFFHNPEVARQQTNNALDVLHENRHALEKQLTLINQFLDHASTD